ncbi:MAG: ABC transporter substrate-binding protein [Planctomycetes bacterium]|nr:ABC transporter substrate-binding protein [Planctomycetota bacterium]MCW8135103.1 ABC transporter substrate-binding protein [Planctomycetota bacterium]
MKLTDLTFTEIEIPQPVRRVVSLVPSITETLFALGAADRLVGRTIYCVSPQPQVREIPTVGGTKNPDLKKIVELRPDLVLANKEENRREDILHLREQGLTVHVCQPTTVEEGLAYVATAGRILEREEAAEAIVRAGVREVVAARDRAEQLEQANRLRMKPRDHTRPRVVAFIWREPWMAAGGGTYIGDMIETLGGAHLLHATQDRYPQVSMDEVIALKPDILLFPDEPFHFKQAHLDEWRKALPDLPPERFRICDGQDLCWFGARIPDALKRLASSLAW